MIDNTGHCTVCGAKVSTTDGSHSCPGSFGGLRFYAGRLVVKSYDPKDFPYPPEPDIEDTMSVREAIVRLETLIDQGHSELLVTLKFQPYGQGTNAKNNT